MHMISVYLKASGDLVTFFFVNSLGNAQAIITDRLIRLRLSRDAVDIMYE